MSPSIWRFMWMRISFTSKQCVKRFQLNILIIHWRIVNSIECCFDAFLYSLVFQSPAFLLLLVTDRQTDWLTDWLVGWLFDRVVTEKQNVFCLFGFLLMCHDWHFFVMRLHVMMRILMVVVMMMMLVVVSLPMAKITNKYSIQFVIQSAKSVYLGRACNTSVGLSVGRPVWQFSVYKLPLMLNTVFGIVCLNKSQNVSKPLTDLHIYINT